MAGEEAGRTSPDAVVFVHAHPDDETVFTGGTMARLAAEGWRTVLVMATQGELGYPTTAGRTASPALLAATGSPPGPAPQGLVDELSSRELDVLRLLRSDLSGPEIAAELACS